MGHRAGLLRLPGLAQDVLLALFITVMQVQGTMAPRRRGGGAAPRGVPGVVNALPWCRNGAAENTMERMERDSGDGKQPE